jgi:hypothetical protein
MRDDATRTRALSLIEQEPTTAGQGAIEWLTRLCKALTAEVGATGVSVTAGPPSKTSAVLAANDAASQQLAEDEFSVGEGPAQDAWTFSRPVLVPELGVSQHGTWPGYAAAASTAGVRGVFAFPLQVGGTRIGVLTLSRDRPGALSPHQLDMCLTMAVHTTERLINACTLPGGALDPGFQPPLDFRVVVYQAQGMVAAALGVGLVEALARIRGHAFQSGRDLRGVAEDIVHNGLRLSRDERQGSTGTDPDEGK